MTEPHPTSRTTLHEVPIDASPARVFEALTRDIGAWWSRDFLVGGERAKRFVLEERVGGSVFEDWGDGQGLEWYRVVGFERGKQLLLAGELFASFGGPARVQEDFQLAA